MIVARSVGSGVDGGQAATSVARVLAYGLHLGARLPAHATSTGQMLLACRSRAAFTAWMQAWAKGRVLPRLTAHTLTDAKAFRARVAQARAQDYCVASQEHELGVFALAVPLRNMQGGAVAALNVVTTPERLHTELMQRDLLPLLLDAARELRPLL